MQTRAAQQASLGSQRRASCFSIRSRHITGAEPKHATVDPGLEDKIREAFQQADQAEKDIKSERAGHEEQAEQRQKDQRFARVKDALNLREQGHDLDPTAGHEQGDLNAGESVEDQTHKNAASPSKAVLQRLLDLEGQRSPQPRQARQNSNRSPVPPLSHHYAAAAWWAVAALNGNESRLGYQ